MEVGSRVRDKNNNQIGIIERQNLNSYLVAFEGGRKLWRKVHELEPETKARSTLLPKSISPPKLPSARSLLVQPQQAQAQPVPQQSQPPQQQTQPQQQSHSPGQTRAALGGGGGGTSPVLGRAALGAGPANQPRPVVGGGVAPPVAARPALGGPSPPPPSAQPPKHAPISVPPKQQYDSTDSRQANVNTNNGSSSNNKVEVSVGVPQVVPAVKAPEKVSSAESSPVESPRVKATLDGSGAQVDDMWDIAFDELEFGDVIGSGKFGEVYLGTYLGTPVAIKKILESDEDTKQAIERELQMLKGVRHPNIVQFLGLCMHKGDIFFVTEYMDRGDLFDILFFGDAPLTWKIKLKIALEVSQPCYYLQAKNILHRDLKSQNILISSGDYKAKLCDLGLARALDTASRRMTFVGTDRWMAPEICLGIDYDYKVDVFSFGVVLMEIITQAVPDERRAQDKFAFNEGAFRAKVPKSCPPGFTQLAIDCTKLDPRTRPSFKSVLDRMKRLYEDQPDEL